MKQLKLKPHLSISEIKEKMRKSKTKNEYCHWICIYLVSTMNGKSAEYISKILGISKSSVYSYVQYYNKLGAEKFISKETKSVYLVKILDNDLNN